MRTYLDQNLDHLYLNNFHVKTLKVTSRALRRNPQGDPTLRKNPVLVPKWPTPKAGWPVTFVLSGFTGNGSKSFSFKGYEENLVETLDVCMDRLQAPLSAYIFVDAWTFWGGSQFINSQGMGRYEDYIIKELVPAAKESLSLHADPGKWSVCGGSSGGYGALHLATKFPETFGVTAAIAPDCFFEASLLPEIYSALPTIEKLGGIRGVKRAIKEGKFMHRKDAHTVLNAIAMGLCYSPGQKKDTVEFPIDPLSGRQRQNIWKRWLAKDPVIFLKQRARQVRQLKAIYIDVGRYDQFHLQYGARQIREILKNQKARVTYSEFEGSHFDIGDRRPLLWSWLEKKWKTRTRHGHRRR